MKTTLDLDDRLVAQAKSAAALERTTLTRLVEEGLALRLRKTRRRGTRAKISLPVFRGKGGLAAGVDPLSNRALLDATE